MTEYKSFYVAPAEGGLRAILNEQRRESAAAQQERRDYERELRDAGLTEGDDGVWSLPPVDLDE